MKVKHGRNIKSPAMHTRSEFLDMVVVLAQGSLEARTEGLVQVIGRKGGDLHSK